MAAELHAGLVRKDLEVVMEALSDVLGYRAVGITGALWSAEVEVEQRPPVTVPVDNGINPIYCECLVPVDTAHLAAAAEVCSPMLPWAWRPYATRPTCAAASSWLVQISIPSRTHCAV